MRHSPSRRRIPLPVGLAVLPGLVLWACGQSTTTPEGGGPSDGPSEDTSAPTVVIASPPEGASVAASGSFSLTGTATDDVGVTEVRVSVDGSGPVVASGTTAWSANLTAPASGSMSVSVVARDAAGNASAAVTRSFVVASGWTRLGAPMPAATAVALGADGDRLMRLPCVGGSGISRGEVAEYAGGTWTSVASLTNQCDDPSLTVEGDVWAAGFSDDSDQIHFASNVTGAVLLTAPVSLLVDQWGGDVGFAHGQPYQSFVSRISEGTPSATQMLHVRRPQGSGDAAQLRGGWGRLVAVPHALETAITGDDDAWYVAFIQSNALYVNRGSPDDGIEPVGDGFSLAAQPERPDIVVYGGAPVVAFLDGARTTLVVARWTGSDWLSFGTLLADAGTIERVRLATDGVSLWVMSTYTEVSPGIRVDRWDGVDWEALPTVLEEGEEATVSSVGDLTIQGGRPVVAFLSDDGLVVKRYHPEE